MSRRTYCCGVRAEDLDEKFPVVNIDSNALDAVRLLAEHRLNGLVVVTDTSETPFAVLPASQVVRFIVPGYVQDDPGLASVVTESMADHAAEKLSGKTIRDMLPKQRQHIAHCLARQILGGVVGELVAHDAGQCDVVLDIPRQNEAQHLGRQNDRARLVRRVGNHESRQAVLGDHSGSVHRVRIHRHDEKLLVEVLCSHRATIRPNRGS